MHYLSLLLRYWWILIIVGGAVGGAAFWWNSQQPANYNASARLFIGNALIVPDPDSQQLETSVRLTAVYAELVGNYDVLLQTVEDLNMDITPEELRGHVSAQVLGETPFLIVNATYTDPQTAADIANAVAENLLETSINREITDQVERLDDLQVRIDELDDLIEITNTELVTARAERDAALTAGDEDRFAVLNDRVTNLTTQLNGSYDIYSQLTAEYNNLVSSTNDVSIVEYARPNDAPTGLGSGVTGVAGLIFGFMIAGIVIVAIDAMDNTVRMESTIRHALDVQIISRVPRLRWSKSRYMKLLKSGELILQNNAEVYRSIVSDIIFAAREKRKELSRSGASEEEKAELSKTRIFAIASPRANTGNTFTAINLAVMSASYGLRTLLLDANMRNPQVYNYFENSRTNHDRIRALLKDVADKPVMLKDDEDNLRELRQLLYDTGHPYVNLAVLKAEIGMSDDTSSTTLMMFNNLKRYINRINDIMNFDIIIADTSPLLLSNDSINMAAHVNAEVLLLLKRGGTRIDDFQKVVEQLERREIPVQGVILNR